MKKMKKICTLIFAITCVVFITVSFPRVILGSDTVIFSNAKFTFYDDRMVTDDAYAGTYRSTDGMTITKDGDASWTWNGARGNKLYLQSPYPILDAAFSLAVDEALDYIAPAGTASAQLGGDVPGGTYYYPYYYWTHGSDIREYTRDTAQHVELGDSVILDSYAAKGTMLRRCNFSNNTIREDAVTTADAVHLIVAAWEYYKITGDQTFLSTTWDCFWNTIISKESSRKKSDGLWVGSPWSDNASGFVSSTHFDNRNTAVKSLYGNIVVAGAWKALGNIASVLGKTSEASTCNTKYNDLKTAINDNLYRSSMGTYCYYKYEPDSTYYDYREDISSGMIYLYGIADSTKATDYHNKFTATNFGYRNADPVLPSGETAYHGGNVWENQEAYHGWLMNKLDKPDDLKNFIFWHARSGIPLKKWQEGTINPSDGSLHTNYTHLIWGDMGYTAYWTRGVFGINYDTDGIRFDSCVPNDFGNGFYAVLNNFIYRDATLRIVLVGKGTSVDYITLDSNTVTVIPTNLTGSHDVKIYMSGNSNPTVPEPRTEEEPSNVALNKTVTGYSSQYNSTKWAASNINDGVVDVTDSGWAAVTGSLTERDEWVKIDLGQSYNLDYMVFKAEYELDNRNLKDYVLYGSSTGAFSGEEFVVSSGTIPSLAKMTTHTVDFTNVSARYIKFKGTSGYSKYLTVGDLEIYAESEPETSNIALNKTVTGYSSQHDSTKWAASNINDGIVDVTDSGWAAVSGNLTGRDEWVKIDLGQSYTLDYMIFKAEYELDDRNLKDYVLYGSSTGAFSGEEFVISSGTIPSLAKMTTHTVDFTNVSARYIKFKGTSGYSKYLTVGDLEIYAE